MNCLNLLSCSIKLSDCGINFSWLRCKLWCELEVRHFLSIVCGILSMLIHTLVYQNWKCDLSCTASITACISSSCSSFRTSLSSNLFSLQLLLDLSYWANLLYFSQLAGEMYCNLARDEGSCCLIFLARLSASSSHESNVYRQNISLYLLSPAFVAGTNMSLQFTESIIVNEKLFRHTYIMWKWIAW